ncbi:MAG: helix-turn-helix transcriptional regulator [Clostridiales bacterium]|nr:helix-turn-helix transcriptional regulator [Clostridiales bacterium]
MKIVNVGSAYRHPPEFMINRPYGSGDYLLVVLRSRAFFHLEGKKREAMPGQAVLFRKDTPQLYGGLGEDFINDWIHFEADEALLQKIAELGLPFDELFPVRDLTLVTSLIKNIFSERYSQNPRREESLGLYFLLLLTKLSEGMELPFSGKESLYYRELAEIRSEIYLSPEQNWNVDEIARRINLSRSYLQHLYKTFFGESLIKDITASRMQQAKYLLSGSDMTVADVARRCGYMNDVHFMRQFKAQTGQTPTQYRLQNHIAKSEVEIARKDNPFRGTKR